MKINKQVAKTIDDYRKGDHITRKDLKEAIAVLEFVVPFVSDLGPRYDLFWLDLHRILRSLKTIEEQRNNA